MKCYLIRHAIADTLPPGSEMKDFDRALTPQGRKRMERVSAGLTELGFAPQHIVTSPLTRARQTAVLLARRFTFAQLRVEPQLAPEGSFKRLVKAFNETVADEVALVGHQPDLGQLASWLLTGSRHDCQLPFKKGGVACLDLGDQMQPGRATLHWFLTPKQLRLIAKP